MPTASNWWRTVDAARQAPAQTNRPEAAASLSEDGGTLLAVVPVNGGSSRLAIVGYLLPVARDDRSARPDEPSADGPPADGLVVDAAGHRVLVSGHDAGLVFLEFELLAFLAANPGRAFSRAHLLARVWGDGYQGTPARWMCTCTGCGASSDPGTPSAW